MKFGRLPASELDDTVLSLPPDHSRTAGILKNSSYSGKTQVYVGCAKWGRKEWVGQIYPKGTKDKDFLANYVKNFNSIELNGTFYSLRRNNVEAWTEIAPEGFKFCPKFGRMISHIKRLKDVGDYSDYYIETISSMGDNLGLAFLQLPENFTPKYIDRLAEYLQGLPSNFPFTVELRHPDWFSDDVAFDETFSLLEECGAGAVITDVAGRRDCLHQRLTTDAVFIRFNGYDLHPTDYRRLDEWVDRISNWIDMGIREVYFFAHQEDETHTPVTADYFIEKLNARTNLDIKRPQFIK